MTLLGMRCTPGGGVATNCAGGGARNTGGITVGGDAGCGTTLGGDARGGTTLGGDARGGTTLGGDAGAGKVRRVKMALRVLIAANWASPGALNGELGWGLAIASASSLAAWVASSAGEDVGTAQRWGGNSTVMLIRSLRVEGM